MNTGTRCAPPELSHWVAETSRQAVIERSSTEGAACQLKRTEWPWVLSTLSCCGTPMSATDIRLLPSTFTIEGSGRIAPAGSVPDAGPTGSPSGLKLSSWL